MGRAGNQRNCRALARVLDPLSRDFQRRQFDGMRRRAPFRLHAERPRPAPRLRGRNHVRADGAPASPAGNCPRGDRRRRLSASARRSARPVSGPARRAPFGRSSDMPNETTFAPYRLAPGALPEEAARAAAALDAEPLVAAPAEPLPAALLNRALADVPAGRAAAARPRRAAPPTAASRAWAARRAPASRPSASAPASADAVRSRGRRRASPASASTARTRRSRSASSAPVSAPTASAPSRASSCASTASTSSRSTSSRSRARRVAQASGALSFEVLPFGRDFWRARNDALERAVADYARSARDAARARRRARSTWSSQFEAVGPAQLRAARHADAGGLPGRRPPPARRGSGSSGCFAPRWGGAPPPSRPRRPRRPRAHARLAAVAATCGIDLSGVEPSGAHGRGGGAGTPARAAARHRGPLAASRRRPSPSARSSTPPRRTSGPAGATAPRSSAPAETLAQLHVQAPVVLRVADAPPEAVIVLADAVGVTPLEAKEVRRRLEAGGGVLAFGEAAGADEVGRPGAPFLPGGKPAGARVGSGTLAALAAARAGEGQRGARRIAALLDKALAALLGKGRRAASRLLARADARRRSTAPARRVHAHLVTLGPDRAQGATLFLGLHVARRRAPRALRLRRRHRRADPDEPVGLLALDRAAGVQGLRGPESLVAL